jgi:transposase-like protein
MGRVLTISLTAEQAAELVSYHKKSSSHVFRQRCQMVLLKASGRKTADICQIVGIKSQNQVNGWIRRYKQDYDSLGISVLRNTKGQGRKPIFDKHTQAALIQEVVKTERQKLENAKVILEKRLNKSFNIKTLKNFLKTLAGDTNA